jgi:hypothetical protein
MYYIFYVPQVLSVLLEYYVVCSSRFSVTSICKLIKQQNILLLLKRTYYDIRLQCISSFIFQSHNFVLGYD